MTTSVLSTHPIHRAASGLVWLVFAVLLGLSPGLVLAEGDDAPPVAAQVNINTADAATLAQHLNGVGLSRAEEIIRYREAHGPFASVEELSAVKGIGPATLERNRARITLE